MAASSDDNDKVSSLENTADQQLSSPASSYCARSPQPGISHRPRSAVDTTSGNLFLESVQYRSRNALEDEKDSSGGGAASESPEEGTAGDAVVRLNCQSWWDWTCAPLSLVLETLCDNLQQH